jgi:hypothetical protein
VLAVKFFTVGPFVRKEGCVGIRGIVVASFLKMKKVNKIILLKWKRFMLSWVVGPVGPGVLLSSS